MKNVSNLRAEKLRGAVPLLQRVVAARVGDVLEQLRLEDVVALQRASALVEHGEQAVGAVDVARQHDDEVALIAKIVGQAPPVGLVERRQLADEMIAHLEQALLGLVGRFLVGRDGAAAAHLHVGFEERLLAGADLDAEFDAVLLGGRGIGGDELVEPVARAPPPALGAQIAQDGGDHGQRHEALLTVDDLEQARLALARLRQVAAGAVDENDRAEKVVGLLGAGPTAKPRRPENILEQLSCFRCGPRVRPLVTGHRKVEGCGEEIR